MTFAMRRRASALLLWFWHRITFYRTRQALHDMMTSEEGSHVPARSMWVIAELSGLGFEFHHVVIQGKDFDYMAFAGANAALLTAGGIGVWIGSKGKEK